MAEKRNLRTRREFIASVVATGVGLVAWVATRDSVEARIEASVLEYVGALPSGVAAAIGGAYLERNPEEKERETLIRLLSATLASSGVQQCSPESIAAISRQEFESAQFTTPQGWVLSRTEARLFALAHRIRTSGGRSE